MATRRFSATTGNESILAVNLFNESTGLVWNGTEAVAFVLADQVTLYDIAVEETAIGSGMYEYAVPPTLPGDRWIERPRYTDTNEFLQDLEQAFRWNGTVSFGDLSISAPTEPESLTLYAVLRRDSEAVEGETIKYRMAEAPDSDDSYDFNTYTSDESDSDGLVEIANAPYGSVYQARWGYGPWVTLRVNTSGDNQQITGLHSGQT